MTQQKHLKRLVRSRMAKTGEKYATARRMVLRTAPPTGDPAARWHFPGSVAATTALHVLLAHAGVRDPRTGEPFTEPMLFGLAGGIGIGVFSFVYEKENHASLFVAGRHEWHDDLAYLRAVCERFGLTPVVRETSSAKPAERHLREAAAAGPCVAWVDKAHLPHRGLPAEMSGGGYHVVTVYRVDDDTALIGDLTDEPISIPLADLARARARIKKQKHRLLSATGPANAPDLPALVRAGLSACVHRLRNPSMKAAARNFKLDALEVLADRMHGSRDKEAWERVFTRGPNLWRALAGLHDYVEHYGTGGGLCRPLFADFLAGAGAALKDPRLTALASRYADLGRQWSDLADAALPDDVPTCRAAKELLARKAELLASDGPAAAPDIRGVWSELGELARRAAAEFPLSEAASAALRADLQARVRALHAGESASLAAVAEAAGGGGGLG
jgi:hypothetical protein